MTTPTDPRLQASLLLEKARRLQNQQDFSASEDCYREAMWLDPSNSDVYYGLAWLAQRAGKGAEGVRYIELALTINPYIFSYHFLHGTVQSMVGNQDGGIAAYRRALKLNPACVGAMNNLIFCADLHQGTTPEYALELRQEFDARFCQPFMAARNEMIGPFKNRPDPDRRIRLGYVSGDFRAHSAAAAFMPILDGHDQERFELYCYSTHEAEGDDQQHAQGMFKAISNWRDISGLSPGHQAQEVADDRIDILVDLSGYSGGSVLQMFGMKPAPVQVSAWGYISGTGLQAMDYLFADAVTVPPELERYYSETIVRMPAIFPYAHNLAPGIRSPAPFERNGHKTYGYLGRGGKITSLTLDVWAQVLRADPESKLILKSGSYRQREVYRAALNGMLARGVDDDRVTVLMDTSREEHLMLHNEVDVILDPMPQTGGISTCDALLMGVPVVTKLGPRLPERVSASILTSIGYAGLVAETVDTYVQKAITLHPTAGHREAIRAALGNSTLTDHETYVRFCEQTYRSIWAQWCQGQAAIQHEPTVPDARSCSPCPLTPRIPALSKTD